MLYLPSPGKEMLPGVGEEKKEQNMDVSVREK